MAPHKYHVKLSLDVANHRLLVLKVQAQHENPKDRNGICTRCFVILPFRDSCKLLRSMVAQGKQSFYLNFLNY